MHNSARTPTYCTNRLFEWCAATMMWQVGVLALFTTIVLDQPSQLAFSAFDQIGMTQVVTGVIFFATGTARLVALSRNGQWQNGPMVRAVAAVIGSVMWGQLMYGIIQVWIETGHVYLSLAIWDTLLVFEGVSFSRAIGDWKVAARGVAQVGAQTGDGIPRRA